MKTKNIYFNAVYLLLVSIPFGCPEEDSIKPNLPNDPSTYYLLLDVQSSDEDWFSCTGCDLVVHLTFNGSTQKFRMNPSKTKQEVTNMVTLQSDDPNVHFTVNTEIGIGPFPPVSFFSKSVPLNYCAGNSLTYALKGLKYEPAVFPKFGAKFNDIACYSQDKKRELF